jgi:dTMP kinase
MPFVTFEGVEGSGKSTQLSRVAGRLRALGRTVRATREPGGTPLAERIREVLLDRAQDGLDPVAEWLLFEAARRDHVRRVIAPALAAGEFVLCDRFSDSTEAYQHGARGLDPGPIAELDARVRNGATPDLTLLFDLDPSVGLARARRRAVEGATRFEAEDLAMHERVRRAFLEIARREPGRVRVIAVQGGPDEVFEKTWSEIARRFDLS